MCLTTASAVQWGKQSTNKVTFCGICVWSLVQSKRVALQQSSKKSVYLCREGNGSRMVVATALVQQDLGVHQTLGLFMPGKAEGALCMLGQSYWVSLYSSLTYMCKFCQLRYLSPY